MKKINISLVVSAVTLLLGAIAHAQTPLIGVPFGKRTTFNTKEIKGQIIGWKVIHSIGWRSDLHLDGRQEFNATTADDDMLTQDASDGETIFELKVDAPYALDRDGNPNYKVGCLIGYQSKRYATFMGGNRWILKIPDAYVPTGLQLITFGMDGIQVGEKKGYFDVGFFTIATGTRAVTENIEITGRLVSLRYKGPLNAFILSEWLKARAASYPADLRSSWNPEIDNLICSEASNLYASRTGALSIPPNNPPQLPARGNEPPQNPRRDTPPALPKVPYEFYPDGSNLVITNLITHELKVVIMRGEQVVMDNICVPVNDGHILKNGKKSEGYTTIRLKGVQNPEGLTFRIIDSVTGKELAPCYYRPQAEVIQ